MSTGGSKTQWQCDPKKDRKVPIPIKSIVKILRWIWVQAYMWKGEKMDIRTGTWLLASRPNAKTQALSLAMMLRTRHGHTHTWNVGKTRWCIMPNCQLDGHLLPVIFYHLTCILTPQEYCVCPLNSLLGLLLSSWTSETGQVRRHMKLNCDIT